MHLGRDFLSVGATTEKALLVGDPPISPPKSWAPGEGPPVLTLVGMGSLDQRKQSSRCLKPFCFSYAKRSLQRSK